MGRAFSEDGELLAFHCSSSVNWSKHDMGLISDWKHGIYKEKYPDGYELEWIDYEDLETHPGYLEALRLSQLRNDVDENEVETKNYSGIGSIG